uniref:Uncharacterized protein n=1 Tax=Rhizophora mucronata TaxID=61149 RepID=A0A2P2PIZ4_RHIMU
MCMLFEVRFKGQILAALIHPLVLTYLLQFLKGSSVSMFLHVNLPSLISDGLNEQIS